MTTLDSLELEYKVFSRMLNHWEELEKDSLPLVLNRILAEIITEQETLIKLIEKVSQPKGD